MTSAAVLARPGAVVDDDPVARLPRDAVVAVALSGGVDSSVAAARVARAGVRCLGITLAMWPRDREQDRDRGCCSVEAVERARRVCDVLDMPHYAWNLEDAFRTAVIDDYAAEYAAGRTPNPCVRCNERVKLGLLVDRAVAAGATHVATGHWARTGRRGTAPTLHHARCAQRDQAYALHRVAPAALARTVLPLGADPDKDAVRAEARALGLATADAPDSQELCFVEGSVRDDLRRRLGNRVRPGEVVDTAGRVVGTHPGAALVTVGQRRGLAVAPASSSTAALHVLSVDVAANRVVAGPRSALLQHRVVAADTRWLGAAPEPGERVAVRLRTHGAPSPGRVEHLGEGRVTVLLDTAVSAVAPGQSLVLSAGDEVLGGGLLVDGPVPGPTLHHRGAPR